MPIGVQEIIADKLHNYQDGWFTKNRNLLKIYSIDADQFNKHLKIGILIQ